MSAGENAGEYTAAMDPNQYANLYRNVNPLTNQFQQQYAPFLQSLQGLTAEQFTQGLGPNAFMNQFMAAAPQFQQLTTDITSPIAQQQQAYLGQLTGQTISQVGNELSKLGAVNSSAFPRLVGEAMAPELAQAATQLASQRAGIFSGLAQTAMPLFAQGNELMFQARQLPYQLGLQGAGLFGQMAMPDMVAPDLQYNPTWWEKYGAPILQVGGQVAGAALMG